MPPPVGTVSVKTPGGSAALATAARSTSSRSVLSWFGVCGAACHPRVQRHFQSPRSRVRDRLGRGRRRARIEGGGCAAVRIDQAGEHHAGQEGHPEAEVLGGARPLRTGDASRQRDTVRLGRALGRTEQVALGLDAAFGAKQIVLQPRMMPRDYMREQPAPFLRQLFGRPDGAGRGVIGAPAGSRSRAWKSAPYLPRSCDKAGKRREALGAERRPRRPAPSATSLRWRASGSHSASGRPATLCA